MKTIILNIEPDGTARYISDDDLNDTLRSVGKLQIERVTDVEPDQNSQSWWAFLRPPYDQQTPLGPFARRDEAIAAEIDWLRENVLQVKQ